MKMPISFIALLLSSIGGCTHHTATILPEPETVDKFQQFEAKLDSLRQKLYIPGMSVVILYHYCPIKIDKNIIRCCYIIKYLRNQGGST
jgi:H+/gluconate symporter-like permease